MRILVNFGRDGERRARLARLLTSRELSLPAVLGGWRGIGDMASPHLLFLVVYTASSGALAVAAWSALAVAALLAAVRLMLRQPFWQAIAGFAGVGVSALIAIQSGHGADFYLPHLLRGAVVGAAFLISIALRWPLIGVVVGPAIGQRLSWRRDRAMLRAYQWCTALWAVAIVARLAVQIPLYLVGDVVALGIVHILLGLPLFAGVVVGCWRILRHVDD